MRIRRRVEKELTESEIVDLILKGKATKSQMAGWGLRQLARIRKMPPAKRKEWADYLITELKRRRVRWN